jgi:hypothetical protein
MPSSLPRGASIVAVIGAFAVGFALLTGQQLLTNYRDAAAALDAAKTSSPVVEPSGESPSSPASSPSPAPSIASPSQSEESSPSVAPQPSPSPSPPGMGATLTQLLTQVLVIPARPNPPGYDRDCGPGSGCVFGPEWNDATSAPDSRNGCDTRNDVLRRDLVDTTIDPDTNGCVVLRGVLKDPYTGRDIQFERGWGSSLAVQVDHLIPLAAAWDLGAWQWSPAERATFANDTVHELLAVDGPTNMSKGDSTPASWLPPNTAFRCEYGVRYLEASMQWKLPITAADAEVLTHVARKCN